MAERKTAMKPIWYFVGLILMVMGGVIHLTGVVELFRPLDTTKVLSHLRPNLWWGELMLLVGLVFFLVGRRAPAPARKKREDKPHAARPGRTR